MARIRRFQAADVDEVLEVWYAASLVGHPFLSEAFLADERLRLAEQWLPGSETFVAERAGRVVGFVSVVDDEVGGLFVEPTWHRQGIGRQLLDHVRSSRGELTVRVFEANGGARRFYEHYGFELVRRGISDVEGQPELSMRLVAGRDPTTP